MCSPRYSGSCTTSLSSLKRSIVYRSCKLDCIQGGWCYYVVSWVISPSLEFKGPAQSRRPERLARKGCHVARKRGSNHEQKREEFYIVDPGQDQESAKFSISVQYAIFQTPSIRLFFLGGGGVHPILAIKAHKPNEFSKRIVSLRGRE